MAVSVDPPNITRDHTKKQGYTYIFLSDEKREVIRRYDLVHVDGGPRGTDIARPAEFLIDTTGTIRWVNLTENYRVRPKSEDILKVVDELAVFPASP